SEILSTADAAARLGVSVRRVQQMVKSGKLPADRFGGSLMIRAGDLKLVANRKPGRPPLTHEKKAARAAEKGAKASLFEPKATKPKAKKAGVKKAAKRKGGAAK